MAMFDFEEYSRRCYANAMDERCDEREAVSPIEEWLEENDIFLRKEYLTLIESSQEKENV